MPKALTESERTARIRALNDEFRFSFVGGTVVLTHGVSSLPEHLVREVVSRVQSFSDFEPDNDPWREHDFGRFSLGGETFHFKIDYYDKDLEYGSEDPADPDVTTRVLTIMLASEY